MFNFSRLKRQWYKSYSKWAPCYILYSTE